MCWQEEDHYHHIWESLYTAYIIWGFSSNFWAQTLNLHNLDDNI